MSIDLSQYEGLRVLLATAEYDGEPIHCTIVVNADNDERPHFVALQGCRVTWSDDRGTCSHSNVSIVKILGELVLPGSGEPSCCGPLQPPVSCTISSDCPETTISKLINTIQTQHSMLIGLVEKIVDSK